MPNVIEEFLAAPISTVSHATVGDIALGKRYVVPADLLDAARQEIAGSRVFDLRGINDTLYGVARDAYKTHRMFTNDHATTFMMSPDTALPLLSPPRVGIHGTYLTTEDQILLVIPDDGTGGTASRIVRIEGDRAHGFMMVTGARLYADGTEWQAAMSTKPSDDDDAAAVLAMGAEAWERRMERPLDGMDVRASSMMAAGLVLGMSVLLANSIAQADPTLLHAERVPARRLRSLRKKGRTVPVGRVWLDLPGLKYNTRAGTWTAPREGGVSWHMVRGHWRLLSAEKWTHKQGQKVWVTPHAKGKGPKAAPRSGYRA